MAQHRLRRQIPFSTEQIFDLVLDVERYPRFVPWWEAARVHDRRPHSYRTDQIVRFKVVRQQFAAVTLYDRPHWIVVRSAGTGVRHFDLTWHFRPYGTGCEIDLDVDLQLATSVLTKMASVVSEEAVRTLLTAFEREAHRMFGTATGGLVPPQQSLS